ncbi:hypothetical protein PVAND_013155 [Polypedilum vanderplanki]|uniref:LEM domain-containing protein n=1 Tax=Polypedilum vanderplanki TaxID=319348 RepID=A0A9J6CPU0_POLVA|nr:hypothetical protein PVAND_013155 [Polypedilum vanderplanki]
MCSKEEQLALSLFEAIDDVNLSNVIILLEKYNASPNTIIPNLKIAPIHFAVGYDDIEFATEVTKIFLKKKADPNIFSQCDSKLTPLHIACIWGRSNIVQMLLTAGGDLNLKCNEGLTPILYAVQEEQFEVIDVIKKFVFEQKLEKKKKELALKTNLAVVTTKKDNTTPVKNSLTSSLQHIEQKFFTPNRINYNFDATSPYYINITHRHRRQNNRTCEENIDKNECQKEEEIDEREEQKNLFELTEKNLKAFSKQMNNAIVIERIAIHKRRSYIAEWREKIQQIRKNDKLDLSYINYLNACNDVTLRGKSLTYSNKSDDENEDNNDDFKLLNDSYVTADSGELKRKENQIKVIHYDLTDEEKSSDEYIEKYEEDYIYSDAESSVILYERKICNKNQDIINRMKKCEISNSSISTIHTLPPLDYDTDTLRQELKSFGQNPGPITKHTKKLYLKKLVKFKKYPDRLGIVHENEDHSNITYPLELQRTVTNYEYLEKNISEFLKLEAKMVNHFLEKNHLRWREGNSKTSFVYLLLDPRITANLSAHYQEMNKIDVWKKFISSIFYIGKGKSSRPYHHLYDAIKIYNNNILIDEKDKSKQCENVAKQLCGQKNNKMFESKKLKRIVDIWKENYGVVCLHLFHNIMPSEAYSREASMIEAIGIHNLTNLKKGDYYGAPTSFTMRQKRQMGISLLYRALNIYLAEGESQMKPDDF